MSSFEIMNKPNAQELWAGIGGNFDSLSQIICEFIDNSISNFVGNDCPQKNILLTIINKSNEGKAKIIVEDSGTGIKNLDVAFTLGSKKGTESTFNEHGFGMKHALASANPDNSLWSIYTRTKEDVKNGVFKRIKSPYKIDEFRGELLESSKWPSFGVFGNTGTIIEFECGWDMFSSLSRGITGGVTRFDTLCDILYEDLGFIYSNIIDSGNVNIAMNTIDFNNVKSSYNVTSVKPEWESNINPGEGTATVNLGGGDVQINYHFGLIKDSRKSFDISGNEITRTQFDNKVTRKYYGRNMSSSGVELRFNGRIMCYNLFKEIWNIEKHNAYNELLITIDLISDDIKSLPETRTSKNGLREGDPKLEKLYEWIRSYLHEPKKSLKSTDKETDIFEHLAKLKEKQIEFNPKTIETEHYVFNNTGFSNERERIDLYVKYADNLIIYEGKKDKTSAKDVYQLRMYWDGLVFDNIHPTKAIIISKKHSSGVNTLVNVINNMYDASGKKYNFEIRTWDDEGIDV